MHGFLFEQLTSSGCGEEELQEVEKLLLFFRKPGRGVDAYSLEVAL